METNENQTIKARVQYIDRLSGSGTGGAEWYEAAMLTQTVLHDTVGGGHPLMRSISSALERKDYEGIRSGSRALVKLFQEGVLMSPRLAIAHEIEGTLLDIAQSQLQLGESALDITQKKVYLALAGFLAGVTLEDALRRLCDARSMPYDAHHTSISKLQSLLFQPSNQIEVITSSENKQITAWGDTRNKADHGKFSDITYAEVMSMVIGVRAFIDKHLP